MMTKEEYKEYKTIWVDYYRRNGCSTPVIATIVIFFVLLFCSCATKSRVEYVDREVVKYQVQVQHDTLIQHTHDSVYHTVSQKGDTIYDTKYVEKTKWRERIVYQLDTMRQDSIITEYKETVREVEKIPKIFTFSLEFSLLVIIFAIYKVLRWLRII